MPDCQPMTTQNLGSLRSAALPVYFSNQRTHGAISAISPTGTSQTRYFPTVVYAQLASVQMGWFFEVWPSEPRVCDD